MAVLTSGPYGTTALIYDPTGTDTSPSAIGDGWTTNITGSGHPVWSRSSNLLKPESTGAGGAQAYRAGATYGISGNGCEFWGVLPAKGSTNGHYIDFIAMIADPNTANRDFYGIELTVASGADTWDLFRQFNASSSFPISGGSGTASATQEFTAGDLWGIFIGLEGSDVRLETYYAAAAATSWTKLCDYLDSSASKITTAGYFGIEATKGSAWRIGAIYGGEIPTEQFGATSSTFTFSKDVAGHAVKAGATASSLTFTKAVAGFATKAGSTSSSLSFSPAVAGFATKAGATSSAYVFSPDVAGFATKTGATASAFTFAPDVAGYATKFGSLSVPIEVLFTTAGDIAASTLYGAVSAGWSFDATTAGFATKAGAVSAALAFAPDVAGFATKTGATSSSFVFAPDVAGFATKAGASSLTLAFDATTNGVRWVEGATSSAWTFQKAVAGFATKYGATSSAYVFTPAVAGFATKFGSLSVPIVVVFTTDGTVGPGISYGVVSAGWSFDATTAGFATKTGALSQTLLVTIETAGSNPPLRVVRPDVLLITPV